MTHDEAATATAEPIAQLASHFMLDVATYERAAGLGFEGMDFYIAGARR